MMQKAEIMSTEEVRDLEKRELIRQGDVAIGYYEKETAVLDAAFLGCAVGRQLIRMGKNVIWRNGVAKDLEQIKTKAAVSHCVRVYQLKEKVEPCKKFISYSELCRRFGGIDTEDYRVVFDGNVGSEDREELYEIFNAAVLPKAYRGHRLTISDVLELYDHDDQWIQAWYLDMEGFVPITF